MPFQGALTPWPTSSFHRIVPHTLLHTTIVIQRFENIFFRFIRRYAIRDELAELVSSKADLLMLIGLLFTHDGENHISIQLAVFGELTHLDGLCQRWRRLLVGDGFVQALLFFFGEIRNLYSGTHSNPSSNLVL